MAAEEGVVIACHNKDEFDAQMTKAKEAGKVVRFLAQNFGDFFFGVLFTRGSRFVLDR